MLNTNLLLHAMTSSWRVDEGDYSGGATSEIQTRGRAERVCVFTAEKSGRKVLNAIKQQICSGDKVSSKATLSMSHHNVSPEIMCQIKSCIQLPDR